MTTQLHSLSVPLSNFQLAGGRLSDDALKAPHLRCSLLFDCHKIVDGLQEEELEEGKKKIGTTKQGTAMLHWHGNQDSATRSRVQRR